MYMLPHGLFCQYGNSYHINNEEKNDNKVCYLILKCLNDDHFKGFSCKKWFSNTIKFLEKDIKKKKREKMLMIIISLIK